MALIRDRSADGVRRPERALDALDYADRREAVRAIPDTAVGNAALAQRLEFEPDSSVRQLILTTLAARQHPEVVRALLPYLASDEPGLRTAVAEALAEMPTVVAAEIPALLEADDHDVRIMTAMMLGQLSHPGVPGWLCQLAATDPHPNVVGSALSELVQLGPAPHAAVFEAAASRFPDDPFIAFMTSVVLAEER